MIQDTLNMHVYANINNTFNILLITPWVVCANILEESNASSPKMEAILSTETLLPMYNIPWRPKP
jgi:hypothetical protein